MQHQPAAIHELDQERDRKTCISLDLKVTGANRELAQWLLDHPRYSGAVVADWLGCEKRRIERLRKWATDGFVELPNSRSKRNASPVSRGALKTNDNSEPDDDQEEGDTADDDIAAPETVEDTVLYIIRRINENARASNKVLRASALDREAAERISTAIERMIQKWRSIQSTLAKKG